MPCYLLSNIQFTVELEEWGVAAMALQNGFDLDVIVGIDAYRVSLMHLRAWHGMY